MFKFCFVAINVQAIAISRKMFLAVETWRDIL